MRVRNFALLFAIALFALPLSAEIVIVEEIIAKVNGDIIARSEYEQALAESRAAVAAQKDLTPEQQQKAIEEAEKNTLRNLIDERLLIQRGNDLSLSVEAQVLRQRDEIMRRYDLKTVADFENWAAEKFDLPIEDLMDQLRNNILSQTVLGQEVGSKIVIPRADIEKYYEEHKTEFVREEGVYLREILISTQGKTGEDLAAAEKKAKEVLERVKKGEPFAEMARRFSENENSAPNGGDIGVWRRGQLRKEIEDLVFENDAGFITDLIEVPTGYLILKVEERFREGQAELQEVEQEIHARLAGPKWNPAVREYLSQLRRDAYIEIRPGYIDSGAVPGMDTSWSDPAKLAPVTTTKEEVLKKKKGRRLLWLIPLPGGGDNKDGEKTDSEPSDQAGREETGESK